MEVFSNNSLSELVLTNHCTVFSSKHFFFISVMGYEYWHIPFCSQSNFLALMFFTLFVFRNEEEKACTVNVKLKVYIKVCFQYRFNNGIMALSK